MVELSADDEAWEKEKEEERDESADEPKENSDNKDKEEADEEEEFEQDEGNFQKTRYRCQNHQGQIRKKKKKITKEYDETQCNYRGFKTH